MWLAVLALACAPAVPVADTPATDDPLAAADVFAADAPSPLYEQLYAGEHGARAGALGDRVRILTWLRALAPDAAQRAGLTDASREVRARLAELERMRVETDARELEALGPTYRALAAQLVKPEGPTETEASAAAAALAAARGGLPDARAERWAGIRAVLDRADAVSATLREEQRSAMRHALFFLRRRVGADIAPAAHDSLLSNAWDANDFGTITRTQPAAAEASGSLDIGAIWVLRDGDVTAGVKGLRLSVLVALALAHEGLCGALEAYAGQRAADDLSPACGPDPAAASPEPAPSTGTDAPPVAPAQ
jgi:hypothetical protein